MKQSRERRTQLGITSKEIGEAWRVLYSIYASKGIDLRDAAISEPEWLSTWRYKSHFAKLVNAGCNETALKIALGIIRSGPTWSNTWRAVVGTKRKRDQIISALEKAASALGHLDHSFERALKPNNRTQVQKVDLSLHASETDNLYVPSPIVLIRALRLYARVLRSFHDVARKTKINSPEAFGKYLISAFVKAMTGKYYDKEVSELIGGALGEIYDERTHCMWRSRNNKHVEAVSFPVELLVGLGICIAIKT